MRSPEHLRARSRDCLNVSKNVRSAADRTLLEDIGAEMTLTANIIVAEEAGIARLVAGLTTRQREILQALARGLSNKEIGRVFNISFKTVEAHRSNMMQRLNVQTSADAVRIAVEAGL